MLASWIWGLVTLFFLLGIKLYHPVKSTLPAVLMGWTCSILIVSFVLYLDGLLSSFPALSWEPLVLSLGLFLFCLPIYNRYLKINKGHKGKHSNKQSDARAS